MRRSLLAVLFGVLIFAIGCGGGSGSQSSKGNTIATPAQNVQAITVDGGPAAFLALSQGIYVDAPFATITICAPGSATNCQQIDHLLVDTGSVGLRLLSSSSGGEFSLTLPATTISGNPVAECTKFVDLSFLWGPVETADVKIAGEQASSIPINVVGDTSFIASPASCGVAGSSHDNDTLAVLGANGILGVGSFPDDCGGACVTGVASISGSDPYYLCVSSGCNQTLVGASQEVQNPVSLFAADNNGVIIELPAASGPQASLAGSMVFGIGTQSNNGLGSATVLTLDSFSNFTTKINGTTMSNSFIDSGSNGLFFSDNSLASCPTDGFYCPPSPTTLSATNSGANGATTNVTFSVINADSTFNSFSSDAVFPGLAGTNGGDFTSFDWGLPFFYGRNVFTSILGTTAPGGQTPYWAY